MIRIIKNHIKYSETSKFKNMKCIIWIAFLIPFLGISQKVNIDVISESRSSGNSFFGNRCEITLNVTGDEVRKHKFAKVTNITKATDDQGLDLIAEDTKNTKYADISGTSASVSLVLLPSSRKAETIKEISGEVWLFAPTEANGGIVKVKTFGKSTNKNLIPGVTGLSLMYVTKESVDKMNAEQKSKKEAELKKQPKEIQELANELMNLVDAFTSMSGTGNEISFYINGEENKLINLYFEKPDGSKIENNGWFSSGTLKTYYFNEEIKETYTLVLTVEANAAVKKIPFSLKGVDLP
jgi:hypothetical protein